jgi:hypothetical protein
MHLTEFLKTENNIMAPEFCTRRTIIGRTGPTADPIAQHPLSPSNPVYKTTPFLTTHHLPPLLLPLAAAGASNTSLPPPSSLAPPTLSLRPFASYLSPSPSGRPSLTATLLELLINSYVENNINRPFESFLCLDFSKFKHYFVYHISQAIPRGFGNLFSPHLVVQIKIF